jgi:hypothetical protein
LGALLGQFQLFQSRKGIHAETTPRKRIWSNVEEEEDEMIGSIAGIPGSATKLK